MRFAGKGWFRTVGLLALVIVGFPVFLVCSGILLGSCTPG